MGRRTIAPRLRLLGLLLICASIIMGLLLSALGVQSVSLSSPFAQEVAQKIQNVSNSTYVNLNANQLHNDAGTSPILPAGVPNLPTTNHPNSSGFGSNHLPITGSDSGTIGHKEPFTISLWALVAPICLVGILLWMTPMPATSSATNRSYKRR